MERLQNNNDDKMSNFAMGTILGKGFPQAQASTYYFMVSAFSNSSMNKVAMVKNAFLFMSLWYKKNLSNYSMYSASRECNFTMGTILGKGFPQAQAIRECRYYKVISTSLSWLEEHAGFFRLSMKWNYFCSFTMTFWETLYFHILNAH